MNRYFITAIGTDSGKTLVSAILVQKLGADYWKPVQCGAPADKDTVSSLVSNPKSVFHPEARFLKLPASPHTAAEAEGTYVGIEEIHLPNTSNSLIVEGAGGILVPLNDHEFVIDIPKKLGLPIILVSNIYLGNINHTLLSIEYLKRSGLTISGIIFNGPSNPSTERIIKLHCPWPVLGHVPVLEKVNPEAVAAAGKYIQL